MNKRVEEILNQIKHCCLELFGGDLTGIYVHGSLAFDCFNWSKSDIDFIVVVKSAPTLQQKESFIRELLHIDRFSPPKGLEMSLVLEKYTRHFVYPTPYELHFSNAHKQECIDSLPVYCQKMNGTDKDLAAHFTVIQHTCLTLYGETVAKVFGEIPPKYYLDSIKSDIKNAENLITDNPVYIILNLCRVLAYIQDDLVLSKKEGGYWGIKNIRIQYTNLIYHAVKCYLDNSEFVADTDANVLLDFARYMCSQIFTKRAGQARQR